MPMHPQADGLSVGGKRMLDLFERKPFGASAAGALTLIVCLGFGVGEWLTAGLPVLVMGAFWVSIRETSNHETVQQL